MLSLFTGPSFAQDEPGFVDIFDGKSLEGWDGKPGSWEVRDGAIHCTGKAEKRNWLIWRGGEPADFILRMDCRWEQGNSGIQVRSDDLGGWQVFGYQVELAAQKKMGLWHHSLMPKEHPAKKARHLMTTAGEAATISAAGVRTNQTRKAAAEVQAGFREREWNTLEIEARGDLLIQRFNGVEFSRLTDRDARMSRRAGFIALQDHGKGCLVAFRKIRIKHLETTPPPPVPDKLVVLTFDDSVASHATVVAPILQKHGFGGTFFITEGFDFATNKVQYMTWEQISGLNAAGFEIGNHSRHHRNATRQSPEDFLADLVHIEERCATHGIPKPRTFCYPGYAASPAVAAILRERGYLLARAGGQRPFVPGKGEPLLAPQAFDSKPKSTFESFEEAVSGARDGKVAILTFHGVPDIQHPWVHTDPEQFRKYMQHLKDEGCLVVALRDLAKYLPSK